MSASSFSTLGAFPPDTRPVIGMIHLAPLPGAPRFAGSIEDVRRRMLEDADALIEGGIDGVIVENFGDAPFFPKRVPAATVAWMSALVGEVVRHVDVPVGVNVLRNDALAGLAVADAADAAMIRVNVLAGARVTDQGLVEGEAHEVQRARGRATRAVSVLADVDVKHSAPLAPRPLEDEARDLVHRALADALIVSGAGTGRATSRDQLRCVRAAVPGTPVLVGSGVTLDDAGEWAGEADGFIVGTAFQERGRVVVERVRRVVEQLR